MKVLLANSSSRGLPPDASSYKHCFLQLQSSRQGWNADSWRSSIFRRLERVGGKGELEAHGGSSEGIPQGSGSRQPYEATRRSEWKQVTLITLFKLLQTLECFVFSLRIVEVFSWLFEVANDTKEHWDGARVVWSVSYDSNVPKSKDISSEVIQPHDEHRKKLVAKLEIQKDDIQSVLPISKVRIRPTSPAEKNSGTFSSFQNWELMNTAVLTGRQVSQVMKVFIVTQAGKVADVTLQSSCHAEDESVIKVSVFELLSLSPLASIHSLPSCVVTADEFFILSPNILCRSRTNERTYPRFHLLCLPSASHSPNPD